MIQAHLNTSVPFASYVGVSIDRVGEGSASASLDQRAETSNHIASQHAGALFTLAEAASGGAMAGAFAEMLTQVIPVAASARISYLKVAKGRVVADAVTAEPAAALRERIMADGKVRFPVTVTLRDADDVTVAEMTVEWYVRRRSHD